MTDSFSNNFLTSSIQSNKRGNMKELKFSQFYEGRYEDIGYELYFLKDTEGSPMYIGISRNSIWHRWFGGAACHMDLGADERLHGKSYIGQVIERRFPSSWNWVMELWTREDCLEILREELGNRNSASITIKVMEPIMITKFQPLYNGLHGGYHEDPLTSKRLDEAYKKLFG